jgi:hypothetical protein
MAGGRPLADSVRMSAFLTVLVFAAALGLLAFIGRDAVR